MASIERRGDLYFQNGNVRSSEVCWQLVLDEHPHSVSARNKLAVLYMKEGRLGDARKLLEQGVRESPKTVSYQFNLALLCHMEGDFPGALSFLERVERMNAGHGYVHLLRGAIYEQMGQDERARKEFIQELNIDPALPAVWARIADLSGRPGIGRKDEVSGKAP